MTRENAVFLLLLVSVGGFSAGLSFVNAVHQGTETFTVVGLGLATALGAVMSVIFLILILGPDRADILRVVAMALLVGFFYKPALEIAAEYFDRVSDQNATAQAQRAAEQASVILSASGALSDTQQNELDRLLTQFTDSAARVDDTRMQGELTLSAERLLSGIQTLDDTDSVQLYGRHIAPFTYSATDQVVTQQSGDIIPFQGTPPGFR